MRKILPILVVGILVLSGLGAVASDNNSVKTNTVTTMTKKVTVNFSPIKITEEKYSKYIDIKMDDTVTYTYHLDPGKPKIPVIIKTFEFPFGVKNIKVDVTPINIKEEKLSKKISPSPLFLPLTIVNNEANNINTIDVKTYSSSEMYPSSWFTYHAGCGLNDENKHVTIVTVHIFPVRYIPKEDIVYSAENAILKITYENTPKNDLFKTNAGYDMVIIAPSTFSKDLQKLIDHKNKYGVQTILKTTEDIYKEYQGRDKPEQIKYFIKDALEKWNVKYVLLVGGLKSIVWGNPRDDANQGSKDWYVPVRYNNIYDNPKFPLSESAHDPGVITDLYYADIYKQGGVFDDWDPNHDGYICAWGKPDVENDTGIDMYPDVALGRLPCRNTREVRNMIDKIITYETGYPAGKDWFNKILSISGDGFLDQQDLNFEWDTNSIPDGDYTIYAQSKNPEGTTGVIDEIKVTVDKTKETSLTFNHDDYLLLKNYPSTPIAKITSPSNGDVLGKNDFFYEPDEREAYCNGFTQWANVEYTDGIMHIRGKSYDPRPYGDTTDIHVWVKNSNDETVFEDWRNNTKMYYEGEWVVGERMLKGGGGALYYLPENFKRILIWTSNGKFTGQEDVISEFNKGSGFTFFSGHGAPTVWADHLAGIPGNRQHASVTGLATLSLSYPFFPMDTLKNNYKNPVVVVGGCHNSQFNVSILAGLLKIPSMWIYGAPAAETWSWWLVRLSKRGGIASIGNTGLGYGILGEDCTIGGLDGGICIEFFKQYGAGHTYLGEAYAETQRNYVNNFDMTLQEHGKSLQQWVLLGDPSLKIGGYSSQQKLKIITTDGKPNRAITLEAKAAEQPKTYAWDIDSDGNYDDATGETIQQKWNKPGVYWVSVKAIYEDGKEITHNTIVDIEKDKAPNTPAKPTGPTNINGNQKNTFETKANDPYDDDLVYLFDWGDGEHSIVGPISSGETARAEHRWTKKGSYQIKVQAFDSYGKNSDWSEALTVTVSKSKTITQPILMKILQNLYAKYPNLFSLLKQVLNQ